MDLNKPSSIVLGLVLITVGFAGLTPATADHPPTVNEQRCPLNDSAGYAELCWDIQLGVHTSIEIGEPVKVPTPVNMSEWVEFNETTISQDVLICPLGEPCVVDDTIELPVLLADPNPQLESISVNPVLVEVSPSHTTVEHNATPHPENVERDVCTTAQVVCDLLDGLPDPGDPGDPVPCDRPNDCSTDPCDGETIPVKCDPNGAQFADADGDGTVDGLLVDYPQFEGPIYLDGDLLGDD